MLALELERRHNLLLRECQEFHSPVFSGPTCTVGATNAQCKANVDELAKAEADKKAMQDAGPTNQPQVNQQPTRQSTNPTNQQPTT